MIAYNTGFAGTTVSDSYNNRLQPVVLSAANATHTVFSLSYNFNQASPPVFENNGDVVTIQNNLDSTRTQAFTYDRLNRIASAQTANSTLWGDTYVIDAWGNLTNKNLISGKGGENLQQAANIKNQFVGMTYDAAGNLINDGAGHAFTYDPENRLLTAGGWSYAYDGDGNRVKKYSGSTGTLYWRGPDGEAINESDLTQSTWKRFVFFNGQRIARRDSATGNVYYFFSDHLGSIGVVTDSLGSTIENESDYYPYGGERVIANSLTDEWYKFTGKERDSESGLDNFEARYFGSSMGRFMSPDPDQDSGSDNMGDPQMWNGYAYVDNNPLSRNDPSGRTVSICDTNGQYCQAVSDEDYAKAQQADQYNHAGSLDQLKEKEGGLSNITDSNGNVVGTVMYTRDENAPAEGVNPEGEKLLAGYAAGGVIGRAFGAAWGTVAGWFGRAGGTAAGEATGQTAGQLGVRAGGVIERVFQTSAGPIQVYAKVEAEGTTAVIKEVAVYPAESNTAVSAGFTQTRQGLKAVLNELKESGFTDFRMEPQYRVGGVNAGGYTGTLKGKL